VRREPAARGLPARRRAAHRARAAALLPAAGPFRRRRQVPSPDETATLSAELDRLGKPHEFHTYDGAGHAFFSVDRPAYRPEAAVDGWAKIFAFLGTHLAG